jgi:hypothetical protein
MSDFMKRGYCMIEAKSGEPVSISSTATSEMDWCDQHKLWGQLDGCMEKLQDSGWPPAFVLLFDEPWQRIEPIIGPDCLLDASVFAWSLLREGGAERSNATQDSYWDENHVGGNFALPHRDRAQGNCNYENDEPHKISVWCCVNDITTDNGCMVVLPKDVGPLFSKSDHRYHMLPAKKLIATRNCMVVGPRLRVN